MNSSYERWGALDLKVKGLLLCGNLFCYFRFVYFLTLGDLLARNSTPKDVIKVKISPGFTSLPTPHYVTCRSLYSASLQRIAMCETAKNMLSCFKKSAAWGSEAHILKTTYVALIIQ